jgi:hypothetical protein
MRIFLGIIVAALQLAWAAPNSLIVKRQGNRRGERGDGVDSEIRIVKTGVQPTPPLAEVKIGTQPMPPIARQVREGVKLRPPQADNSKIKKDSKEIGPVDIIALAQPAQQNNTESTIQPAPPSEAANSSTNAGLSVGVIVGLVFLGVATILGVFWMRSQSRKAHLELDIPENTEQAQQKNELRIV